MQETKQTAMYNSKQITKSSKTQKIVKLLTTTKTKCPKKNKPKNHKTQENSKYKTQNFLEAKQKHQKQQRAKKRKNTKSNKKKTQQTDKNRINKILPRKSPTNMPTLQTPKKIKETNKNNQKPKHKNF